MIHEYRYGLLVVGEKDAATCWGRYQPFDSNFYVALHVYTLTHIPRVMYQTI